jgi:hypothetical protein
MVHFLTADENSSRPRVFCLFFLRSGIVAQGLDFQFGHPLHQWLRVVGFGLGSSTLSGQPFPLHPSGNAHAIIANRVRDLEALSN